VDIEALIIQLCTWHYRLQVLRRDLAGRDLAAPVFYPGSVERTSLAERGHAKGYSILEIAADPERGGRIAGHEFRRLPARPMLSLALVASSLGPEELENRIRDLLRDVPRDAVVSLRIEGDLSPGAEQVIRAARLRTLHPPSMTVEARLQGQVGGPRRRGGDG
jgi:hypothetical protein